MGLIESFGWIQRYGKKQGRRLMWRAKAAIKKAVRSKQQFEFRYDPHSYALNFDDGTHQELGRRERDCQQDKCPEFAVWVFVVWVD
ncbi:hypothetical protein ACS0TY_031292 [Phlomoides rotata]